MNTKMTMISTTPAYTIWFAGYEFPFEAGVTMFGIIGTTGSGKTTFIRLMMQSFIPYIGQPGKFYDQRCVLYDVKQEMLSILFGAGVDPEKVILLHPYDTRCAAPDFAKDYRTESQALQFATALVPETNENTRFFNDAARDCIAALIVAFNYLAPLKWDFRDLIVALSNQRLLELVLGACPYTEDRLQYFEQPTTGANIMSTIRTKIAPFRSIAACWHRAEERVSLTDWIRDKNGSFLVLGHSEQLRAPLSAINQILFQRLAELTLDLDESSERRIYFVLDEIRHLGKLEALPGLLTNGRSKGAVVILGFQSYEGMCAVWGKEIASEIIAMCANQAHLRLSSGESAQWSSDQFSFRYQEETESSQTSSVSWGPEGTTTSESKTIQTKTEKRERVMPSKFLEMPNANAKNGISGCYISPWFKEVNPEKTTFLQKMLTRQESFDRLMRKSAKEDNFIMRPVEDQILEPWNEDDFKRLNLKHEAPQDAQPVKPPPSNNGSAQLGTFAQLGKKSKSKEKEKGDDEYVITFDYSN
jgi:type IV secretory pathway TraG/TraD family ATPase VirD4